MCPKLEVLLIEDNPGDAAMTPDRESSDDALILAADQALYQAKQEGRR